MRAASKRLFSFLLLLLVLWHGPAPAAPIWDRVADGPAAETIRESLRCLDRGERTDVRDEQLTWYERGRALAEEALRKDDRDSDAHFALFANWGRIILLEGLVWNLKVLPEVRAHLDRAIALDPENPNALAAQGGLYRQLPGWLGGDTARAEPLLLRAAKLDPAASGTRLELAELYVETDRPALARDNADAALRIAREEDRPHHARRALALLEDLGVEAPPADSTLARR